MERKCNKNTCFEKKLKTVGAWNKQNINGIDPSIDRLAMTLGKSRSKLVQNDFTRVAGMGLGDEESYDKSINADLSINETNPFAHLSIFSINDSGFPRGKASMFWISMKRRRYF